jgi:hypothetical protein
MRLSHQLRVVAPAITAGAVFLLAVSAWAEDCPPGQAALSGPAGGILCVDLPDLPEMPELPPPEGLCLPPYQVLGDGVCSWSCAPGTRPDPASGECVCLDGLTEAGLDADGRRVCTGDPAVPIPIRAKTTLLFPPPELVPQSHP